MPASLCAMGTAVYLAPTCATFRLQPPPLPLQTPTRWGCRYFKNFAQAYNATHAAEGVHVCCMTVSGLVFGGDNVTVRAPQCARGRMLSGSVCTLLGFVVCCLWGWLLLCSQGDAPDADAQAR